MSVAGLLDAMRSSYPPAVRLVWQCLENHANGHRVWRMTNEQIAAEMHLGLNTVSRAVAVLEKDKIIEVERHRRRCSDFTMLRVYPEKVPKDAPKRGDEPAAEPELTPQNGVPTAVVELELTPQNGVQTIELTPQNGVPTAELTPQNGLPESTSKNPPVSNPPTSRRRERPRPGERECLFQTFYEKYPKKKSKDAARKALFKRLDAGVPFEEIMAGLDRHVFTSDPQYIPHPARWLNAGQWMDEDDDRNTAILKAAGLTPDRSVLPGRFISKWELSA